jgi:iron complex transport system ATP-binding protein
MSLFTQDLSIGYRSNKKDALLFDNLTLSLKRNSLTCFMGPNGVGKSTLLRTLAGLQKPLKGKSTPLTEKDVALVLTDKIIAANMGVMDLVSYGRYPHIHWNLSLSEEDQKIISNSIKEANITHLAERNINELSDGQLQMVLIARALAQQTPILFLDEPTAHLDLNNRMEIMSLLRRLAHEQNKAILVATHELDLALQMADEIWLAMPDKKIKSGIPEDLVLDGSFDEVFQFKGFDLKTGKVKHTPYRERKINLIGEGPEFLWTKNALEREGFLITANGVDVVLLNEGNSLRWKTMGQSYSTLNDLLDVLKKQ